MRAVAPPGRADAQPALCQPRPAGTSGGSRGLLSSPLRSGPRVAAERKTIARTLVSLPLSPKDSCMYRSRGRSLLGVPCGRNGWTVL